MQKSCQAFTACPGGKSNFSFKSANFNNVNINSMSKHSCRMNSWLSINFSERDYEGCMPTNRKVFALANYIAHQLKGIVYPKFKFRPFATLHFADVGWSDILQFTSPFHRQKEFHPLDWILAMDSKTTGDERNTSTYCSFCLMQVSGRRSSPIPLETATLTCS